MMINIKGNVIGSAIGTNNTMNRNIYLSGGEIEWSIEGSGSLINVRSDEKVLFPNIDFEKGVRITTDKGIRRLELDGDTYTFILPKGFITIDYIKWKSKKRKIIFK